MLSNFLWKTEVRKIVNFKLKSELREDQVSSASQELKGCHSDKIYCQYMNILAANSCRQAT